LSAALGDVGAAVFRTIFAQPDPDAMASTCDQVRDQLASRFTKIGPLMDDAKAEVLAFNAFPRAHWRKIWSTNPLARLNKEIKRRSRVVGIFPNEAAVTRLVGAVLIEPMMNGRPTSAATYPKHPWRCCTPTAVLVRSPQSAPATRHRRITSKPTTPRGLAIRSTASALRSLVS
jgi:hypothetical protein